MKRIFSLVLGTLFSAPLFAETQQTAVTNDDTILYILGGIMVILLFLIIGVGSTISNLAGNKDFWKNYSKEKTNSNLKTIIIFIALWGISNSGFSLSVSPPAEQAEMAGEGQFIFWLLFITDIILAIVLYTMIKILNGMTKTLAGKDEEEKEDVLEKVAASLTSAVPIENEETIMMDHEYDGIRELDNVLPPWWVGMFYATIIFGLIYVPYYHFGSGQLQAEEYESEVVLAEEQKAAYMAKMANSVNESNVKLITDEVRLENGRKLYMNNCIACHGVQGEGGVGPNLTDEYWIHGGGIKNVFKTIKYGIPEKGMIAWQAQMTPAQLNEVASYILNKFQGTNPSNGKEPQGDLYKEAQSAQESDTISTLSDTLEVDTLKE
ncbi:MAG: c-type cytochrome [Flavobacteriales bacterium]|nr:c-type cytochrome [Flavobacteriales bacterium]